MVMNQHGQFSCAAVSIDNSSMVSQGTVCVLQARTLLLCPHTRCPVKPWACVPGCNLTRTGRDPQACTPHNNAEHYRR